MLVLQRQPLEPGVYTVTLHVPTLGYTARLAETLPLVRERMARAEELSGREVGCVRLVAVTKSHPVEAAQAALAAGLRDLGENRVEELEQKVRRLGRDHPIWHMIGHLQSRKVRRAAELAHRIHSVDSVKLGEKISRFAEETRRKIAVLVQINSSGETAKGGFDQAEAVERVHEIAELRGLQVDGLMTMAPLVDDERVLSNAFAGLREVRDRVRAATSAVGSELSMGMTNDLEIAIREGSTMVRIGTALFGERQA